jgi:hypothetical protein
MSAGVLQPALPPRSMVGQLPLEQPIGVRIPGGQPNKHSPELPRSTKSLQEPMFCGHFEFVSVRRGAPGAVQNPGVRIGVQFLTKWGTTLIPLGARRMALTDTAIRTAKPGKRPYKIYEYDRDGLFLLINPSGSKLWRWRYRFGGKEKLMALGSIQL